METTSTLMQSIREAASKLKDGKLKRLNLVSGALKRINDELGFHSPEEAMAFVAILDRQCGGRNTDLDDLSNYFECTSLDVMQFVPAINSLISQGYLTVENKSETLLTNKNFMVCPDVLYAIIEGRKVDPVTMTEEVYYDQFDFCTQVHKLIEDRENGRIETRKLFIQVERMEKEFADMPLVAGLNSMIDDIESRTLFYEMCKDFTERSDGGESDINDTLEDIYERILDRAKIKKSIVELKHPLIVAGLIKRIGDDDIALTNKGIELLFGDKASAFIKSYKVADRYEFVEKIDELVDEMHNLPTNQQLSDLYDKVEQSEIDNGEIEFIAKVKSMFSDILDRIILYLVCKEATDCDKYSLRQLSYLYRRSMCNRVMREIKEGNHILIKRDLVEVEGNGIFDGASLSLTDSGKELFFGEDLQFYESKVSDIDMILPEKISEKRLFFEANLQRQLSMLGDSLAEDNYKSLCQRLADNNLPSGVAVLLYGNPGTGKTESVMQIARATGRAIVHVDISATKTCWFGESEKLIKEVFAKYRRLCEKSKIKPILLFNEADAVFSKRKDSNSSSVAQTENAIQNIILEEMERLEGILIATTNLAENLDKAFERRFLFKIRFDRPTVEAKRNIWLDKLRSLSADEATMLAERYDFSGGEIDNITRKVVMTEVLEGTRPTIESIVKLCNEEKIGKQHSARVGFIH